jgi:Sulfotransferase domain
VSDPTARSGSAPWSAMPRPVLETELARLTPDQEAWQQRPRPLFIAACPRSGTNWLGALLSLHPHVICTGEFTFHAMFNALHTFTSAPGRLAQREPMRTHALRGFQRFVREMMWSLADLKPGVRIVGDHTPRPLRVFLPEASYLVIVRDARDVVVSLTFSVLARKAEWAVPPGLKAFVESSWSRFHAVDGDADANQRDAGAMLLDHEPWVRHATRIWLASVSEDLPAVQMIQRGELSGRAMLLRYEDLHADTQGWRDRLLTFLGVDPALAQPLSEATRTAPGFAREDATSHFRSGKVGDWREKLPKHAQAWIEQSAGTELARLGY